MLVVNQGRTLPWHPSLAEGPEQHVGLLRSTKIPRERTTQEDVDLKNRDGLCAILVTAYAFDHVEM